mgnify:CR=1 FL=1
MMRAWFGRQGLQVQLLFSYLVVVVGALAAVALGMRLVAPSLFNRLLMHNMGMGMMGGAMTSAMQDATERAFQTTLWQSLALAMVLASLVALVVSVYVTRRITTQIRRMAAVSQRIARGEYTARAEVAPTLEIGELAESLNRMAAELETTEQRRVQLIGDVAHEMRTPISTIQGYLEGLRDGVVEPSDHLWTRLFDQAGRLNRLTEDLHELFQVESGVASIERRATSPGKLVQSTTTAVKPQFEEKRIDLFLSLPAQLPTVLADPDRAGQVLTNLLTNALRYTPPGGTVTVSAEPEGRFVWFHVADTGVGIPPVHLPHLFDRFYRVDPSRSRALGGSGIGLSIARTLVEAQGGQIRAESPGLNQGSTFSFSLPLA